MKTTIIVPTRVLTQAEIIFDSLGFKDKANSKQKFINCLISIWIIINDEEQNNIEKNNTGLVNIPCDRFDHIRIIIDKVPYYYPFFISLLKEKQLIVYNKSFSFGTTNSYTKAYGIHQVNSYQEGIRTIKYDLDMYKRYKTKEYYIKKYPKFKKAIEDSYEVFISLPEYYKFMTSPSMNNHGLKSRVKYIMKRGKEIRVIDKPSYSNKATILNHYWRCLKVNMGYHWFSLSDEGRFYSAVTNLPTTAKPFIKLKQLRVKYFDLYNAQPLLLNVMFNNKFEQYKLDTENNQFYKKIASLIYPNHDYNDIKAQLKVSLYEHIFFNDKIPKTGKIKEAFDSLYPGVLEEIGILIKEAQSNNSNLARELQKIESNIFIQNTLLKFDNVLTRHDEVMYITEGKKIKNHIKEYIKNQYNLNIDVNL